MLSYMSNGCCISMWWWENGRNDIETLVCGTNVNNWVVDGYGPACVSTNGSVYLFINAESVCDNV